MINIQCFLLSYLILKDTCFFSSGFSKWGGCWLCRLLQAYVCDSCVKFCGTAGWSNALSWPTVTTINQVNSYDTHFCSGREWFSRKWFVWFTIRTKQSFIWSFREVRSWESGNCYVIFLIWLSYIFVPFLFLKILPSTNFHFTNLTIQYLYMKLHLCPTLPRFPSRVQCLCVWALSYFELAYMN